MAVSKTIGPLHFEDLEPRRFEDLVRQLFYDFREWKLLEATGRSGSEGGFDVRGWETVRAEESGDPTAESAEEEPQDVIAEDRLWLIQCKREKAIGPKKLVGYLESISEEDRKQIYGVIVVAACDFSRAARDQFRAKCRELGFAEAYVFGKAEIEDLLFQPKNDSLLFAYFGVSLAIRKRSLKTNINGLLTIKRKATKHLSQMVPVLLRDSSDDRYPYLDDSVHADPRIKGRWCVRRFDAIIHAGVVLLLRRHFAYLDDDGIHWDYAETVNDAKLNRFQDLWQYESDDVLRTKRDDARKAWEALPEKNRAMYEIYGVIPFDKIIAIDELGDECFDGPHLYTTPWIRDVDPFTLFRRELQGAFDVKDDEGNRIKMFPRKTP